MSFPLFKVVFAGFRLFSRPVNNLIKKTLKNRGNDTVAKQSFIRFGHLANRFEIRVNRFAEKVQEDNDRNESVKKDAKDGVKIDKSFIKPISDY